MAAPIDHASRFRSVPAPGRFGEDQVVRDLGDGLVLRCASERDVEALDGFNRVVHADPPDYADIDGLGGWARDLVSGSHPSVRASDFWLVDDTARGRLASTLCLIPHRMSYDGIGFDAGQIELVGTHPDYRKRGLVRAQMEVVHTASAERGQVMQWISGIPWYYRQFGYEMALETDGARVVPRASLPPKADSKARTESLRLRDASPGDAAGIAACLRHGAARLRLSCDVEPDYWRWEIESKSDRNLSRRGVHLIEDDAGLRGVLLCAPEIHAHSLRVVGLETAAGTNWSDIAPFVLESLTSLGERYAAKASAHASNASVNKTDTGADAPRFEFVRLQLGTEHPVYAFSEALERDVRPPYALFVRIAKLREFLELIAPVLEARLANSAHAGRSGELDLNFYRSGLRLRFAAGRLEAIEPWQPTTEDLGDHGFPDFTFLQLLTGFRSLRDLQYAFPDAVEQSPDCVAWLDALFPRAPSLLIPGW